ncbi:MAG: type I pullulanase [Ruminococcus sp.]|nr:type I pullulanase [Ruminococcus sp.]
MKMRRMLALMLTIAILGTMAVFSTSAADSSKSSAGAGYFNLNKYSDQVYSGTDLGATYSAASTTFKVWSPAATKIQVKLYKTGTDRENGAGVIGVYDLKKGSSSVWSATVPGDHKNQYYTYLVTAKNTSGTVETNETQDIYSKAVGANGDRSMVVDLKSTDPEDWKNDKHVFYDNISENNVWELHVRDFSADPDSGVSKENQGNYLAFTEGGTTYKKQGSVATCIDYLVENNVNAVQLLPFADYDQVDEINGDSAEVRNWGYNPKNYNVPDGVYSSNAYDGNVRINEVKQMIQALHDRGIAVIMDVVYNHTAGYEASCFTKTVPGYYYRMFSNTQYSGGSGQGNELATENGMVRNFIVQSLYYWATEYHIDGFRFDLMGCIDSNTLRQARTKLNSVSSKLPMYGEPWTGGDSVVQGGATANKSSLANGLGVFSEEFADAAFDTKGKGASWLSGTATKAATVVNGIKGNIIDSGDKTKTVNYIDNHDNYTIWDRITGCKTTGTEDGKKSTTNYSSVKSKVEGTDASLLGQLKVAGATVMTSQGVKFMNSGDEFARTKKGTRNSYNSNDDVNMLHWDRVIKYKDTVDYFKGLRQISTVYTPFHDDSSTSAGTISVIKSDSCIAYTISNNTKNKAKEWGKVAVILNAGSGAASVSVPGSWTIVANDKKAGLTSLGTCSGTYSAPARSAAILVESSSYKDFSKDFTYGTLTTKHVVNGTLKKTTTAKYRIGTKYHALKDADILIDNNVTGSEGTVSGTFTGDTTVTYNYESNGKKIGVLTVDYVDANSKKLAPSMSYRLERGDKYSIPVCSVEGYQLNTDKYPSGTTGTFAGQDATIKFIYKPLATQTTIIHYYRSQSAWASQVFCYAYTDDGDEPLGAWTYSKSSKALMKADSSKGNGWFTITIPVASCKVMFHGAAGQTQEPGQNEPGYAVAGECTIQNKVVTYNTTLVTSYIDIDTGKKLKPDSSTAGAKKSTDQYTTKGDDSLGKLVETPANAAGFYAPGVINVVYLYRNGEEPTLPTEAPTEKPTEKPTEGPTDGPTDGPTTPQPTTAKPTASGDGYLFGDADLNGSVTIKDVTYIQKYLAKLVEFTDDNFVRSEIDGNGVVNIKDATLVQKWCVKLPVEYPIGEMVK